MHELFSVRAIRSGSNKKFKPVRVAHWTALRAAV